MLRVVDGSIENEAGYSIGGTHGSITYTDGNHQMTVYTEVFYGEPNLVVYRARPGRHWRWPHQKEWVDQETLDRIAERVKEAFEFRGWIVEIR